MPHGTMGCTIVCSRVCRVAILYLYLASALSAENALCCAADCIATPHLVHLLVALIGGIAFALSTLLLVRTLSTAEVCSCFGAPCPKLPGQHERHILPAIAQCSIE